MAKFSLGIRSRWKLRGVHPDLVAVVRHALQLSQVIDFAVVCGLRTHARQVELFAAGASKTMDSRHLTGHAVDLAPYVGGKIVWNTPPFYAIVGLMKASAHLLDVPLQCGADFNNGGTTGSRWIDLPHFQLPRGLYHETCMEHLSMRAAQYLSGGAKAAA